MLFKRRFHAGLADGSITLTYRVWARPQVKPGGRYRVGAIGLIEVDAVDRVRLRSIRAPDARQAGFASRAELVEVLRSSARGGLTDDALVFRIRLHHAGPDDRPGPPAQDADLSDDDVATLVKRLRRLDDASGHGAWTARTLALIERNPRVPARELAQRLRRETQPFKADVRKLKRLGLTVSFDVGYALAPRGRAFLERTRRRRV